MSRKRDFLSGRWKGTDGNELDVYTEVDKLVKMFADAKETSEANHPETYSPTKPDATGTKSTTAIGPNVGGKTGAVGATQGTPGDHGVKSHDGAGDLSGEYKD